MVSLYYAVTSVKLEKRWISGLAARGTRSHLHVAPGPGCGLLACSAAEEVPEEVPPK